VIYVDEELCTGCGVCLDVCKQGALSIEGGTASIDEALCTSCGRCIEACVMGAIISAETIDGRSLMGVPARSPQAQPVGLGTTPLSPAGRDAAAPAAASPAPARPAFSKLEAAERILSGLLSFASFVLDRRQIRSESLSGLSRSTAKGSATSHPTAVSGGLGCPGSRQGRGDRGQGRGRGLGRGTSPRLEPGFGSGRGCGAQRGRNERNRST